MMTVSVDGAGGGWPSAGCQRQWAGDREVRWEALQSFICGFESRLTLSSLDSLMLPCVGSVPSIPVRVRVRAAWPLRPCLSSNDSTASSASTPSGAPVLSGPRTLPAAGHSPPSARQDGSRASLPPRTARCGSGTSPPYLPLGLWSHPPCEGTPRQGPLHGER